MKLKAGTRLRSAVCPTEVVVVRAPDTDVEVACGGSAMAPLAEAGDPSGEPAPDLAGGTQLGKRYALDDPGIELLCTKAGAGSLTVNGEPVPLKEAKPLPSSD